MILNFFLSRSSPTNLTSPSIWVIGISPFFSYRPSLRFQAQVPSTLYVRVCVSSIRAYRIRACLYTTEYNCFFKCDFGDLERSRSTGEDLEIVLCAYSVYHQAKSSNYSPYSKEPIPQQAEQGHAKIQQFA